MNADEQLYYDAIRDGMLQYQTDISFADMPNATLQGNDEGIKKIKQIGEYVLSDHPEIFWYGNAIGFSWTDKILIQYSRTLLPGLTAENIPDYKAQIEAAALEIYRETIDYEDDYDITKAVFDRIVTHTAYDYSDIFQHSVYGVLIKGKGVCDGYTKAFQYLLNYRGIRTIFVWGYGHKESHAWCLVNNHGFWYQTDITWADPTTSISSIPQELVQQNFILHMYFNLTSEQMYLDHKIASAENILPEDENSVVVIYPLPVCDQTADNYFLREGALFSSYDFDTIAAYYASQINNVRITEDAVVRAEIRFENKTDWETYRNNFSFSSVSSNITNPNIKINIIISSPSDDSNSVLVLFYLSPRS